MTPEAQSVIARLGLRPLPGEGGFFTRTWTGRELFHLRRPAGSAICFLITLEDFSAFHRLRTDEIWHFHAGDPAEIVELDPATGSCRVTGIGPDILEGDEPQVIVPGGAWQAARIRPALSAWRAPVDGRYSDARSLPDGTGGNSSSGTGTGFFARFPITEAGCGGSRGRPPSAQATASDLPPSSLRWTVRGMNEGERPMNSEARAVIRRLGLFRVEGEGGYLKPLWTSGPQAPGGREWGSTVYFFVTPLDFSGMHRFVHDEVWHFHAGDPAEIVELSPQDRSCRITPMGPDVAGQDAPQVIVSGGAWQAARIRPGLGADRARGWTLFGCTLAPAWDPKEYELGKRAELLREFPEHARLIEELTNV